jgi:hypothetical protein
MLLQYNDRLNYYEDVDNWNTLDPDAEVVEEYNENEDVPTNISRRSTSRIPNFRYDISILGNLPTIHVIIIK